MTSLHEPVNALHAAYCTAMCIELPLNFAFERWWLCAVNLGLTPEDVTLCVRERLKFNLRNQCKKGIEIKHLCRDEDDVAVVLNEVAVIRAGQRIKVMDPARASVLEATGRPATMPASEAKHVSDLDLIKQLRQAAK